jgi:hypothetical protein
MKIGHCICKHLQIAGILYVVIWLSEMNEAATNSRISKWKLCQVLIVLYSASVHTNAYITLLCLIIDIKENSWRGIANILTLAFGK